EQCIAREDPVVQEIGKVTVCVPGSVQWLQSDAVYLEWLAFLDTDVGARQPVEGRRRDTAAHRALYFQRGSDVVGMNMGIDRADQFQAKRANFLQVAVHARDDRVDQDGLPGIFIAQE